MRFTADLSIENMMSCCRTRLVNDSVRHCFFGKKIVLESAVDESSSAFSSLILSCLKFLGNTAVGMCHANSRREASFDLQMTFVAHVRGGIGRGKQKEYSNVAPAPSESQSPNAKDKALGQLKINASRLVAAAREGN